MQGPDTDAQDQPPPFLHIRLATHGRSIQKCHLQKGAEASSPHPMVQEKVKQAFPQEVHSATVSGSRDRVLGLPPRIVREIRIPCEYARPCWRAA